MLDHLTRASCLAQALKRCGRGNSAVEFAFAAPVLILIVFGAFDYGSAYVEALRLTGAAQAGVQQVLYDPVDWDNTDRVEQAALEEYFGETLTPDQMQTLPVSAEASAFCACTGGATLACSATCPGGTSPGRFMRVRLARSVPLILPYPWATDGQAAVDGAAVVRAH